ncbi:malignant fibrous histiocytoma-amplified sequence 1 homolog [Lingula anatina]|uniref:Malignant fibrous histiocytoma-amplified sequence 1 homolog n=1 Tax=Lingula anatina TaxID=7574 RepID=A0A1S3II82_LINAN|nr:malignant fibrous histiocytoma-amplified sequence 1 homolog [Lingula anatina]|eukprot:XP_013397950.1 malignant fibrous histiocytoma-amplified sequence 1 homolog [Lingula anatina]
MALVGTHVDKVNADLRSTKCSFLKKELAVHKRKKQEWFETQMKKIELKMSEIDPKQISMHEAYKNKVDKLRTLKDQVSDIHDHIFLVSSKTKTGLNELKHYLTSFAREHAVILPGIWVEAATDIFRKRQDSSENTLNLDTLKQSPNIRFKPKSWRTFFMKRRYSDQKINQTIYDILSLLAQRGDIIWFETSPLLNQTVFHNQEILANLLKVILNHDVDATIKTLQDSLTMTAPKKHDVIEDLRTRGVISKTAMLCLWQPFNLSSEEVDAMTELMQKLELCYQVQEDESLPANTSFHFPWLLTEERQAELDTKWPSKVPPNTTQLTLQVLFSYKCPDGLHEKFSVRQHKHLGLMKTMRIDWKDGVYAEFEGCKMQLTRGQNQLNPDPVSQDPDWVISIAVRGSHLSDIWRVFTRGHSDLMAIINDDWPGLSYDKYLVCPHCVSENSEHPTFFPGEILDQTIGTTSKPRQVPCVNTGVFIPADLVYPPSWQEVLCEKQSRLCEKITEPCLKDMLNEFLQEFIITHREAEMVRAEPPQHHDQTSSTRVVCPEKTAVFLDILKTRGDEAFDLLKKCLTENGQSELASLLK